MFGVNSGGGGSHTNRGGDARLTSQGRASRPFCMGVPSPGVNYQPPPTNRPINPTIVSLVFPSRSAFTFYIAANSLFIGVAGLVTVSCYVKIYQTPPSQEGHSSYGMEEVKITKILHGSCSNWFLHLLAAPICYRHFLVLSN